MRKVKIIYGLGEVGDDVCLNRGILMSLVGMKIRGVGELEELVWDKEKAEEVELEGVAPEVATFPFLVLGRDREEKEIGLVVGIDDSGDSIGFAREI